MILFLFNQTLEEKDFAGAAEVANNAPGNLLRNQGTINKLKAFPTEIDEEPLITYLNALINLTRLNQIESIEFAKSLITRGQLDELEQLISQQKLTISEELSDIIGHAKC